MSYYLSLSSIRSRRLYKSIVCLPIVCSRPSRKSSSGLSSSWCGTGVVGEYWLHFGCNKFFLQSHHVVLWYFQRTTSIELNTSVDFNMKQFDIFWVYQRFNHNSVDGLLQNYLLEKKLGFSWSNGELLSHYPVKVIEREFVYITQLLLTTTCSPWCEL